MPMSNRDFGAVPVSVTYCHWGGAAGALVRTAAQLPTRQLSWRGSMSWRELPATRAGQGGRQSYWTAVTVRLLEPLLPGWTSESVWPGCKVPLKVSNMGLVAPQAAATAVP